MKKLLLLLLSTGITLAPVTSIISCGSNNNENSENPDSNGVSPDPESEGESYSSLKNKYLDEVNAVITKYINKSKESWIEAVEYDSVQNNFFNSKVLKEVFQNVSKAETKSLNLETVLNDSEIKSKFIIDVENKISLSAIQKEVESIAKKDEYNILTNNINKNNLVELDSEKFSYNNNEGVDPTLQFLNEENIEGQTENNFTSSLENVNLNLKINYKSENSESLAEPGNYIFNFDYKVTTYGNIVNALKTKINDVKYKYLLDDNNSTIIESTKKGSSDDDKIDSLESINSKLKETFGKEFLDSLIADVNGVGEFDDKVELKSKGGNIIDEIGEKNSWDYEFNSFQASENMYTWKAAKNGWQSDSIKENVSLFNYIFRNNADNKDSVEEYLNKNHFTENEVNLKLWFNNYKSKIIKDNLDSSDFSEEVKNQIIAKIDNTMKFKFIEVKNLELIIKGTSEAYFKTDINSFSVATAYTIDKSENLTEILNNKDKLTYKSIVANLNKGIDSFHNIWGITNVKNDNAITAFTGETNVEYDNKKVNLWTDAFDPNYISGSSSNNMYLYYDSVLNNFNENLSLKQSSGSAAGLETIVRNKLLNDGNQSIYDWNFYNFKSVRPRVVLNKNLEGNEKGLVINNFIEKQAGDFEFANLKINFDFMQVTFRVDTIFSKDKSNMKNKSIIEKA
ncbi:hypothetical protein [Spiroplasma turonicum]|uniref:Lipoprotein n=1 Tax=Spiroplasma turonicum TaxID=216946 RepID=A0A0K1P717_9MOLU|nr:hypothetical protein [Spiroplasma turonicum]AKU80098.1 hypothetical protein STURON_00852 [Spiroplasma turonicum]ALX71098.1 hypothetical protein STURO_v1c08470 [Spiroplasma turonicum]